MQQTLRTPFLSSVSVRLMTTLNERLTAAMESTSPKTIPATLARACGISTAAVAGWFTKENWAMQATHCFALAKLLRVDPEWLATGKGQMTPGGHGDDPDRELIEASRENDPTFASFLQDYRRLSSVEKTMVRTVVVSLARSHDPAYLEYEKARQLEVGRRDRKRARAKP